MITILQVNHRGTKEIETKRLLLRQFNKSDVTDMLENWISDPEIQYNYGEPIYGNATEVNNLIESWISQYINKDFYRWAIILKDKNINIGQIAFYEVDIKNNCADVEYCIGKKYQRNGYVTEALRSIIDYAFDEIGFNRIQAFHRSKNIVSGKVLEKVGMKYEGTLRKASYHDGQYDDRIYYGILKGEHIKNR